LESIATRLSRLPVPRLVKDAGKHVIEAGLYATSALRTYPDFAIIGAQKAGTSSLYEHLATHPAVMASLYKEVQYFTMHSQRSTRWYRMHFPTELARRRLADQVGQDVIVGEASPYYLFHPAVPERMHALVPDIKLVALLRDPVDRAISHYHHSVRWKQETLSLEEALDAEEERLRGEGARLLRRGETSVSHRHHSYKARGVYIEQLRAWERFFSREQLLVLRSEDLFAAPESVLPRIREFLGLKGREEASFAQANRGGYADEHDAVRESLKAFFAPHNQALKDEWGICWESA